MISFRPGWRFAVESRHGRRRRRTPLEALTSPDMQLLTIFLLTVAAATASANRGFIFTAPKRLLVNSTELLCLSLHNVSGTAHVNVDVLFPDSDEKITSAQTRLKHGLGGCMEMYVPPTMQLRGRLHLKVSFDDHYDYNINSVKEVYIQPDPLITFIETDKPVYKPGEEVLFRILTITHNLQPVINPISRVWIESPAQIRLAQWVQVETQQGLVQLSFQLSHEPPQGMWEIKVQHSETRISRQLFEVREYVLPKFDVTVIPPDYILADAEFLAWNICAKYSFGQPVKGKLYVKAISQFPRWRPVKVQIPEIEYTTELNSTDGCATANITGKELGLQKWDISPNLITVIANVTEAGTSNTRSAESSSTVLHQALKLEFVSHNSRYFKPGLPYKGKLKVLHQNNVPVADEIIQLCLKVRGKGEWSQTLVVCRNFTSNENGFVNFLVLPQHHNVVLLSFVATAVNYQTNYYSPDVKWRVFMNQPAAVFDVYSWYSPSESYLEIIDNNDESLQCGSRYQIEVYYTTKQDVTNITFYYMIQSKGDVIMLNHAEWHAQHENINFEQRFSNILSNGEEENRNNIRASALNKDGKQEMTNQRKIGVFPINLKISPQLSPESYLLVYYVRDDGEVVATNHILKIHNCFANKVQTRFPEGSHIPGSDVWIEISAAPKSLCTLSAVDKSTSFLGKVHRIDKKRVFQDISRFHIDMSSGPRQSDPWEYCTKKSRATNNTANGADGSNWNLGWPVEPPFWDLKRRRRSIATQPFSKYVDSIQAFDDFGAVVMSDLMLETRPCNAMTGGVDDPNLLMNMMPLLARSAGFPEDSLPAHGLMASSPLAYPLTVSAAMPPGAIYADEHRQSHTEVRSFFPETWLWELMYIGDNGKVQLKKELPHTVTDWVGNTICVSPELGLGISPTTHITAFQPFFLELTFPYSIKRGEIVLLKASLFNFLSYSLPVRISFEESFGIELLSNNSVTVCVKERESIVHSFRIQALDLGDLNITISAEVDPFYPQECGPENIVNRRDVIVKPVKVIPEGFPMEIIKSQLLCSTNDSDYMEVSWNLQLPPNIVEDSARADLSIVGDLLGPALQNLDNLVKVPMGCGEQNMILFVPNLHVINYMNATHQENSVLHAQALKNMEKGYQRELNYRHTDGSYSAFGNSDAEGSMWLTAFVLKSFAQSRKHIFIDENDLIVSMNWIIQKQLENGCFPLIGSVFHKELKGGMSGETSSSALSAFVLISLVETQLPISSSVISNTLYCLQADSNPDLYTLSLKTYALTLVGNRELAESSLQQFLGKASQQQDLLWWEIPGASLSLNIEMTAYGILALVKLGGEVNLVHALQAIRWISRHRNTKGGFISTQDTVVALEALGKYARTLPQNDESGFDVTARVTELENTFHISQEERLLQHQLSLPVLPTPVEITVKGTGCVLAQASLRYNMKNPQGSDAFELEVTSRAIAAVDKCTMQKIEACIRTKHIDQTTNMAVLEVFMVTGYVPDRASLYQLSRRADTTMKRWEEEREKVNFYFEELNHRKQCIVFHIVQETEVENPSEATVKLYDYYQQELTIRKTYNIDDTCKIERLPYPVPDVHGMEEEENLASNFTVMQADTSNTTENASLEGLNPLFVNVDHELEVPSGEEGPVPSYARPQADRDFSETISCPSCEASAPSNFSQMYCNSAKVFKLIMRKAKTARLLMDLSGSRSPRRMRKLVQFLLHRDCRCPSLDKTGGQVILLLDRDLVTAQSEEDKVSSSSEAIKERNSRFHQMALNNSAVLISIESQPGQPEIIKVARSTC